MPTRNPPEMLPMPARYYSEDDVAEILDMETAIEVLEAMFAEWAEGRAGNVPRVRAAAPGVTLHSMSAAAEYLDYVGLKVYVTTKDRSRFQVFLYRKDGEPAAVIEARTLGQLRTGAASAVATEYLARPDSHAVGLFGAGFQARAQLKAVCLVRKIKSVEVYARNAETCSLFAEEMSEFCNTEVIPVANPLQVAAEKDIVITATTSRVPLFDGRELDEGTHLNVIGSNYLHKAEIDVTTLQRADVIVCDSIAACREEAGDFVAALEQGCTDWSLMHNLADVVAGRAAGRAHADQITLFKSVGLAIEDVALAARFVELAAAEGLGQPLPY